MKIIISILILLNLLYLSAQDHSITYRPLSESDSLFYDYLLKNGFEKSPYIILNVKAPDYTGQAAIESMSLFYYFLKTKGLRKPVFDSLMMDFLQRNDTLIFEKKVWEGLHDSLTIDWRLIKVIQDSEVEKYSRLGKEKFLDHFFDYKDSLKRWGTLKEEVYCDCKTEKTTYIASCKSRKEAAIAAQLYKWRIGSKPDYRMWFIAVDNRPMFIKKGSKN